MLKIFEYVCCYMFMWGVGVVCRVMDEFIKYLQECKQYGKLIVGYQLIVDKIVIMVIKIDVVRLLIYCVIDMVEWGVWVDKECVMVKWFGIEIVVIVAWDVVEIYGGNGVIKEFIVECLV